MRMLVNFVVILLLLTGGFAFQAQAETMLLEDIELQHKPAGDIIPLIEPLLPENAVITGEGYKIILKTTAENLPQVKQLIAELDTPRQQLQIAVSLDPAVLQQQIYQARIKPVLHLYLKPKPLKFIKPRVNKPQRAFR